MYRSLLLLIIATSFTACKAEKKQTPAATTVVKEEPKFDKILPDMCSIIPAALIAEISGIEESSILVKDGSHPSNSFSRACFFKWEAPNEVNPGIMVQALSNPVKNESPDYLELFINSKLQSGEQAFDSDSKVKFQPFTEYGDHGAYSYEMHKYIWRRGHKIAFTIAFNNTMSEQAELAAAKRISAAIYKAQNYQ